MSAPTIRVESQRAVAAGRPLSDGPAHSRHDMAICPHPRRRCPKTIGLIAGWPRRIVFVADMAA
eukprot:7728853-Pyramimonas_sp.AAC.1